MSRPGTADEPRDVEPLLVRVGTWNVQSAAADKNAARLAKMLTLDCDVWVLTETNDDLALPEPYTPVHSDPRPTARQGGRWVTIWSRPPGTRLPTTDPVRTAAVELDGVIVYGTVLPWDDDPGPDPENPLRTWDEFKRVTEEQSREWQTLRKNHPDKLLIVAGDLNQSLGEPNWYWTDASRHLLRDCLRAADLNCLTEGGYFPEGRLRRPSIDHVCAAAPSGTVAWGEDWVVWEGETSEGITLSDHSGLAITVRSKYWERWWRLQDRGDPVPWGVMFQGADLVPRRYVPGEGLVDWPCFVDYIYGPEMGAHPITREEALRLIEAGVVKPADLVIADFRGDAPTIQVPE